MKHILICLLALMATLGLQAQPITRAEYFIGPDPGPGMATALTVSHGADSVSLSFSMLLSRRAPGLYRLATRVRAGSTWSQASASLFYVAAPLAATSNAKIVRAEYFLDQDPGAGRGIQLATGAPADSVSPSFTLSATALSAGLHHIGVRAKGANGAWSQAQSSAFYILPAALITSTPNNKLARLEYFIDTDPGTGLAKSIPVASAQDSLSAASSAISLTGLPAGMHRLAVRARSAKGVWSQVQSSLFYVLPATLTTIPQSGRLVRAEYFFDQTDPGLGLATALPSIVRGNTLDMTRSLAIAALPAGQHTVSLRVADSAGRWSQVRVDTFKILPSVVITSLAVPGGGVGLAIIIHGYGFSGATSVKFNGVEAINGPLFALTDNMIQVSVPAGATTGKISVTTPHGTAISPVDFIVWVYPTVSFKVSGNTLTASPQGPGYQYSWQMGGAYIAGATSPTYTITQIGLYRVEVTVPGGCSDFSAGKILAPGANGARLGLADTTGLQAAVSSAGGALRIWPNPSKGVQVFVQAPAQADDALVEVYDAGGRRVLAQPATQSALATGLKLEALPTTPGLYTVRVGHRNARLVVE